MFDMHGMFRGLWQESPFQKGDLKYVILDLIKDKPRHGYEVIKLLAERSHGFYTPSPGAVYPTLQYLEEMGYAGADERDGKKIYSITDEGRKFLAERKQFADGIKKQMQDRWGHGDMGEMREAMVEVGKLGRLIGQHFRDLDAEKIRRIKDVISQAYKDVEVILEH